MTTYSIVFKGELRDGFTRDAVTAAFQARGNLSDKQVEQVFSGRTVTLKKGLTRDEAKRFARDLRALGMRVIAAAPAAPKSEPAQETGYRILFAGEVVDGFAREAVMLMASSKLKFSDAQRDLLFSGREVTMKRGLGEDKARHYLGTLRKLGMQARVEPPLPVVEPPAKDPLVDAAEASLVETQLAQTPGYNFEDTFHSSSTIEMAQAAREAADLGDIHPALLAPTPPAAPPPVADAPGVGESMTATVINDDVVKAYEAELSGPDVDPGIEALRAAHDPQPAVAPASVAPVEAAKVEAPPAPSAPPIADAGPDSRPAPEQFPATSEPSFEVDEDAAALAAAARQKTLIAGVVAALVIVVVLAWWLG